MGNWHFKTTRPAVIKSLVILLLVPLAGQAREKTMPAWEDIDVAVQSQIRQMGEDYKKFLGKSKIESEVISYIRARTRKHNFRNLQEVVDKKGTVKAGDKLWYRFDDKNAVLILAGNRPLTDGYNLLVAHTDAPHLRVTPRPLVSERDMVLTSVRQNHTSKEYQWISRPLAIHGEVITEAGRQQVVVGEEDGFSLVIPDLSEAAYTPFTEDEGRAITKRGKLKVLTGSIPIEEKNLSYSVHMQVLKYFYDQFGMTENDFLTANLQVVPAGKPRDVGLGRHLVGGYGHDGRAGCFAMEQAFLSAQAFPRWGCCLFINQIPVMDQNSNDRLWYFLAELTRRLAAVTGEMVPENKLRAVLGSSRAVVAEVTNGVNPLFEEINELGNAAFIGNGVVIMKYLGVGGKYFTNEATPEYMAFLRKLCTQAGIFWQQAEFGKVDEGGGSSLSRYVSEMGLDVVDVALPVLSMHSPFAICSKFDLYEAYRFYQAFLESQ
jgi:aspartyl aminopeptidase